MELIESCLDCAQTCTACAGACLGEQEIASLVKCIRDDLDCADVWPSLFNREQVEGFFGAAGLIEFGYESLGMQ